MGLKKETAQLKKHIKSLNIEEFIKVYENLEDPYELEDCLVTEILKHYPEILCCELEITNKNKKLNLEVFNEKKEKIITKMNLFFDVLIENGFIFNDDILSKRYDEPIKFFKLYDSIGLNHKNIFGNTILHMQVRGLHENGVELLLEKAADPNIINSENKNCFDILFLDQFIAYKNEISFNKKLKIAKMLIKKGVDKDRLVEGKNIFERTLYNSFIENNGRDKWDLENLKIIKIIMSLSDEKINKYIEELILFISNNKSFYDNEELFKVDLNKINLIRKELIN